jgi:hypothetical protein
VTPVIADASLLLILLQILGRRRSKSPLSPNSVDLHLSNRLDTLR